MATPTVTKKKIAKKEIEQKVSGTQLETGNSGERGDSGSRVESAPTPQKATEDTKVAKGFKAEARGQRNEPLPDHYYKPSLSARLVAAARRLLHRRPSSAPAWAPCFGAAVPAASGFIPSAAVSSRGR